MNSKYFYFYCNRNCLHGKITCNWLSHSLSLNNKSDVLHKKTKTRRR